MMNPAAIEAAIRAAMRVAMARQHSTDGMGLVKRVMGMVWSGLPDEG
jgi:hypothetical protein